MKDCEHEIYQYKGDELIGVYYCNKCGSMFTTPQSISRNVFKRSRRINETL